MTRAPHVLWHAIPLSLPHLRRHCSTCGGPQPFRCSGKVRLNANGRRLDAWLIYKCALCDRTWNLPLLDRVALAEVSPADLAAMQSSDPAWVRARAFNLAALRRHAVEVHLPEDLVLTKSLAEVGRDVPTRITLAVDAPWPTGLRLDRLLAQELHLSRSKVQALLSCGGMVVETGALKLPLARSSVLQFDLDRIEGSSRAGVEQALLRPQHGASP